MDRRRTRSGSQTFASYLSGWLENLEALDLVSERTLKYYRYFAGRHLIPNVGPVVLEELTAEDLGDLYTRLRKGGVGVRTVNHVHSTARTALSRAVKKRLISHNPARDADPPRYSTDGREYAVLSRDDVSAFFEAAKGDRFEALFALSVLTGMRPAEARRSGGGTSTLPAGRLRCAAPSSSSGASRRRSATGRRPARTASSPPAPGRRCTPGAHFPSTTASRTNAARVPS